MSGTDPSKRIPKSLHTDANLFGTYTLTDLAVALFPGVVVILFTQIVLPSSLRIGGVTPQTLTLPIAAVGIALGVLFVYLTPEYTSSLDWVTAFITYRRSESELADENASAHAHIERVHPEDGVIERRDGALFSLVHVTPPTMALATDREWASKADAFQNFCNTTVEFPIQIFSTTQPFPAETYLENYESRLEDPDVQANPQLRALIEEYIEWYEEDLEDRRMTIRDHYVVVPVSPNEIQFERTSPVAKLAAIPIVGLVVRAWLAPSIETQYDAMVEEVNDRISRIETGLRGIEGCHASRVDVADATEVIAEFWAGKTHETDFDQRLRTTDGYDTR